MLRNAIGWYSLDHAIRDASWTWFPWCSENSPMRLCISLLVNEVVWLANIKEVQGFVPGHMPTILCCIYWSKPWWIPFHQSGLSIMHTSKLILFWVVCVHKWTLTGDTCAMLLSSASRCSDLTQPNTFLNVKTPSCGGYWFWFWPALSFHTKYTFKNCSLPSRFR